MLSLACIQAGWLPVDPSKEDEEENEDGDGYDYESGNDGDDDGDDDDGKVKTVKGVILDVLFQHVGTCDTASFRATPCSQSARMDISASDSCSVEIKVISGIFMTLHHERVLMWQMAIYMYIL